MFVNTFFDVMHIVRSNGFRRMIFFFCCFVDFDRLICLLAAYRFLVTRLLRQSRSLGTTSSRSKVTFAMEAMAVESGKGRKKYVDDGFLYVLDKPSVDGTKLFWRCEKRNDHCKARLHTNAETGQVWLLEVCKIHLLNIMCI